MSTGIVDGSVRGESTPHPDFLLNAENLSLSHKGRGKEA